MLKVNTAVAKRVFNIKDVPRALNDARLIPIPALNSFLKGCASGEKVVILTWGNYSRDQIYNELLRQRISTKWIGASVSVQNIALTGLEMWVAAQSDKKSGYGPRLVIDENKYAKMIYYLGDFSKSLSDTIKFANTLRDFSVLSRLSGLVNDSFITQRLAAKKQQNVLLASAQAPFNTGEHTKPYKSLDSLSPKQGEASHTLSDQAELDDKALIEFSHSLWNQMARVSYSNVTFQNINKLVSETQRVINAGSLLSGGGFNDKKLMKLIWARSPPSVASALKLKAYRRAHAARHRLREGSYVMDWVDAAYQPVVHSGIIEPVANHVILVSPLFRHTLFREFAAQLTIPKENEKTQDINLQRSSIIWNSKQAIYALQDGLFCPMYPLSYATEHLMDSDFLSDMAMHKKILENSQQVIKY